MLQAHFRRAKCLNGSREADSKPTVAKFGTKVYYYTIITLSSNTRVCARARLRAARKKCLKLQLRPMFTYFKQPVWFVKTNSRIVGDLERAMFFSVIFYQKFDFPSSVHVTMSLQR